MGAVQGYLTHIRETIRLAGPIAFAQVAYHLMTLVDMAIVGRITSSELAVVSIGNALLFAAMCPVMGVALAVEPKASQAVGAKDPLLAWNSMRGGLLAVAATTLPLLLVSACASHLLIWLGVDPVLLPTARRFIWARLPSIPLWLGFVCVKSYLEALGHVKPLVVIAVIANLVNLIACMLLALGDRAFELIAIPSFHISLHPWGAFGAGIATSFANLALIVGALIITHRRRPPGATWWTLDNSIRKLATDLTRLGIPIGLHLLTEFGVFGLSTLLAARLGATTVAAHQIALGLASFTFMVVIGIGNATAVRVGRTFGAGTLLDMQRAGFSGMSLGALYMLLCGVGFLVFAQPLAQLFTSNTDLVQTAVALIRIAAFFQIADGVQGVAAGALRGRSDTTFAFLTNFIGHWFVGLPLALYLAFHTPLGVKGLWWGLTLGLYVVSVALVLRFVFIAKNCHPQGRASVTT